MNLDDYGSRAQRNLGISLNFNQAYSNSRQYGTNGVGNFGNNQFE